MFSKGAWVSSGNGPAVVPTVGKSKKYVFRAGGAVSVLLVASKLFQADLGMAGGVAALQLWSMEPNRIRGGVLRTELPLSRHSPQVESNDGDNHSTAHATENDGDGTVAAGDATGDSTGQPNEGDRGVHATADDRGAADAEIPTPENPFFFRVVATRGVSVREGPGDLVKKEYLLSTKTGKIDCGDIVEAVEMTKPISGRARVRISRPIRGWVPLFSLKDDEAPLLQRTSSDGEAGDGTKTGVTPPESNAALPPPVDASPPLLKTESTSDARAHPVGMKTDPARPADFDEWQKELLGKNPEGRDEGSSGNNDWKGMCVPSAHSKKTDEECKIHPLQVCIADNADESKGCTWNMDPVVRLEDSQSETTGVSVKFIRAPSEMPAYGVRLSTVEGSSQEQGIKVIATATGLPEEGIEILGIRIRDEDGAFKDGHLAPAEYIFDPTKRSALDYATAAKRCGSIPMARQLKKMSVRTKWSRGGWMIDGNPEPTFQTTIDKMGEADDAGGFTFHTEERVDQLGSLPWWKKWRRVVLISREVPADFPGRSGATWFIKSNSDEWYLRDELSFRRDGALRNPSKIPSTGPHWCHYKGTEWKVEHIRENDSVLIKSALRDFYGSRKNDFQKKRFIKMENMGKDCIWRWHDAADAPKGSLRMRESLIREMEDRYLIEQLYYRQSKQNVSTAGKLPPPEREGAAPTDSRSSTLVDRLADPPLSFNFHESLEETLLRISGKNFSLDKDGIWRLQERATAALRKKTEDESPVGTTPDEFSKNRILIRTLYDFQNMQNVFHAGKLQSNFRVWRESLLGKNQKNTALYASGSSWALGVSSDTPTIRDWYTNDKNWRGICVPSAHSKKTREECGRVELDRCIAGSRDPSLPRRTNPDDSVGGCTWNTNPVIRLQEFYGQYADTDKRMFQVDRTGVSVKFIKAPTEMPAKDVRLSIVNGEVIAKAAGLPEEGIRIMGIRITRNQWAIESPWFSPFGLFDSSNRTALPFRDEYIFEPKAIATESGTKDIATLLREMIGDDEYYQALGNADVTGFTFGPTCRIRNEEREVVLISREVPDDFPGSTGQTWFIRDNSTGKYLRDPRLRCSTLKWTGRIERRLESNASLDSPPMWDAEFGTEWMVVNGKGFVIKSAVRKHADTYIKMKKDLNEDLIWQFTGKNDAKICMTRPRLVSEENHYLIEELYLQNEQNRAGGGRRSDEAKTKSLKKGDKVFLENEQKHLTRVPAHSVRAASDEEKDGEKNQVAGRLGDDARAGARPEAGGGERRSDEAKTKSFEKGDKVFLENEQKFAEFVADCDNGEFLVSFEGSVHLTRVPAHSVRAAASVLRLNGPVLRLTDLEQHFANGNDHAVCSIKSIHGKYLGSAGSSINWNAGAVSADEKITIEKHGGLYALRNKDGNYLSAQNGSDYKLQWNRKEVKKWEKWTFEEKDLSLGFPRVAMKSHRGRWLSAQEDGTVHANLKKWRGWELFDLDCNLQSRKKEDDEPEEEGMKQRSQ